MIQTSIKTENLNVIFQLHPFLSFNPLPNPFIIPPNIDCIHHLFSPMLFFPRFPIVTQLLKIEARVSPLIPLYPSTTFNFSWNYHQSVCQICAVPCPGHPIFWLHCDSKSPNWYPILNLDNCGSILNPTARVICLIFKLKHVTPL